MTKQNFKHMPYQAAAVASVVDIFKGQPHKPGFRYRIDPGMASGPQLSLPDDTHGLRNEPLMLSDAKLLDNIQTIQRAAIAGNAAMEMDSALRDAKGKDWYKGGQVVAKPAVSGYNFDVEMETGTGKTYVYIKTMFELNKLYGWSKFIVMVPSIAIREGVYKTFQDTADHFQVDYGTKANVFIYNSKHLDKLESFSSNAGIQVMIINTQAFAANQSTRGKDARRIYMALDDFNSRRPIDVIKANKPILIMDEPQKMEGKRTVESLKEFEALFTLRYSATHKTEHNLVHRLDALDAYNQKLVKKISVRGISVRNLPGSSAYLYASKIDVRAGKPPRVWLDFDRKQQSGKIVRKASWIEKGDNLFDKSGQLPAYRDYLVKEINKNTETTEVGLGVMVETGRPQGDESEDTLRRIQIRETIKAHIEKERVLFHKGIKVLSLFFIDSVAKYRLYDAEDTRGQYAKVFEEEYANIIEEMGLLMDADYRKYLSRDAAAQVHEGYFSMDKNMRLKDPKEIARGERAGETDDESAYDLILKNKGRLLSIDEPVRFIFSHSALREGWDNPNVFQICTLKQSNNEISRRQEVGRGLRICVNAQGDRMDDPAIVHDINVLTVIASESYEDFVKGFQDETAKSLHARPRKANSEYFEDKVFTLDDGSSVPVSNQMARDIERYLIKNDYTDNSDHITDRYHTSKEAGVLAELPDSLQPYAAQVFALIDSVFDKNALPDIGNDFKSQTNNLAQANFDKKEFQTLWKAINRKAVYTVHFDTDELIENCVRTLDIELKVAQLSYGVKGATQKATLTQTDIDRGGSMFGGEMREDQIPYNAAPTSTVKYDLIGELAQKCELTRKTIGKILGKISPKTFAMFALNPEMFISGASKIIMDKKGSTIVSQISYDLLNRTHDTAEIFAVKPLTSGLKNAVPANRHVFEYVPYDSNIEKAFVENLEASSNVVVYAKLPGGFKIPTPVGNYNPDWAIAFEEGSVKHVYFVAETKGGLGSLELRGKELAKIDCARKFFDKIHSPNVKYDVATSFEHLLDIVAP